MAAIATTITPLTPAQFADRMAALFPPGWSSPQAKSDPAYVLRKMLTALGSGPAFSMTALEYALDATRIQTAQNGALDLASEDYFGFGLYALPRLSGETDASYQARILAALLPAGATRQSVSDAVQKVTGVKPRITEPWRPSDTGVLGGQPGQGMVFWGVDTTATPFRWTNPGMGYQGFIQSVLPLVQVFGPNRTPCYDISFYWGVAGSSFIDPTTTTPLGAQAVYDAINRTKCEGTIAWVQFVPFPQLWNWDQPGVNWDESGVNWDQ